MREEEIKGRCCVCDPWAGGWECAFSRKYHPPRECPQIELGFEDFSVEIIPGEENDKNNYIKFSGKIFNRGKKDFSGVGSAYEKKRFKVDLKLGDKIYQAVILGGIKSGSFRNIYEPDFEGNITGKGIPIEKNSAENQIIVELNLLESSGEGFIIPESIKEDLEENNKIKLPISLPEPETDLDI